ncbi:MAG: hydroxymethylbilane synthase [Bacteroidetes bacterium]|nr:hydroxymethylbilane synthase [Bacteroidota bacterium]
MKSKIIIGSRGSDLALWQANFILRELKKIKFDVEIKIIKTQGDIVQNLSWDKMEGKGFFTKEIEDALLNKEIDLAVHSHKDLPTEEAKGLIIAAVSEREDPSELLLINKNAVDEKEIFFLKQNAIVGTSSARRKSQMLAWRNDLQLEDLRGNVPTRIQKLRDKKYDAILIANAGVSRLEVDLSEFHSEKLDPKEFIPAPAQGVLALQIRESDKELFQKLQKINSKEIQEIISVERKVMNLFQGGCQLPLGVYCEKDETENGNAIYKVRIAKADKWNSFPKYFYFESKMAEGFAKKNVEKIKSVKPSSVFISRDEKKNDFFKRCLEANGYKVFCQSLIEIKQIPLKKFPKTDWIFFSSKNAVKYFFKQNPTMNGAKFGAVSKSTAEEIRRYGKRAEFIGSADNTKLTGKKFSSLIGNKKVLFPQAKGSMKTIQQQLKKEQVIDVAVYETIKIDECQLPTADCQLFIFTSPSNVEAFLEKNKISAQQKVIAMGDATANALQKYKVKVNAKPASFDDLGLVQAVMSL